MLLRRSAGLAVLVGGSELFASEQFALDNFVYE
jgi:hypothetical protein